MAEDKKGFLLYADYIDTFEYLSNEDRGKVIWWVLQYVNDKHPEPIEGSLMACIAMIRAQLKRDLDKYEQKTGKNSESGRIGNLKRWQKDLYDKFIKKEVTLEEAEGIANDRKVSPPDKTVSPPIAKIADTVNGTVTDTDTVTDIKEVDSTTAKAIDFNNLLIFTNKLFGRGFKKVNEAVRIKYKARLKEGYTSEDIKTAMQNCKKDPYHIESNYKYCTPEFFSRADKLDLHSSIGEIEPNITTIPKSNYNYTG